MAEDQISTIIAGLADDHMYISPLLKSHIDPSEQAQIAANIAKSPTPIYVIAIPLSYRDQYGGDGDQVAALVIDRTNQDGSYLVAGNDPGYALSYTQNGPPGQDLFEASWVARQQAPKDQGQQLVIATGLIANGTVHEQYEKLQAAQNKAGHNATTSTQSSSADDSGHGTAVFGSVAVVLVIAIGVWLLRRGKSKRKTLDVPRSVLARVARARNETWRQQAGRELLTLGRRIEKTHLDPKAPTAGWQAALDHYDAAREVLDRSQAPADSVGALVLLDRANAALDAAIAGKQYTPTTPCYFNPLHGPAKKRTTWGTQRRITVPACTACDTAIKHQNEPDILDVTVNGKSVHYYDAGVEPWASTGYGALNPDLIAALH